MTTEDNKAPAPAPAPTASEAPLIRSTGESAVPARAPRKTPMWQAMHASRYQRQDIIKKLMAKRERELICYVGGSGTEISRDDVLFLSDLLYNIPRGFPVDFLLHTNGGDPDAAQKLSQMIREVVGTSQLTVVVPDFAKSSGTLIALGADEVMMSDSSELGPIDPQIVVEDDGKRMVTSLHSYLSAYEEHEKALRANPEDPVAKLMLAKFDPAKVHHFRVARQQVRKIAETQLRAGMFRPPRMGNYTGVPRDLMNVEYYQSHGHVIGYRECKGLGLQVDYRPPGDEVWDLFWQLYCLQRLEITEKKVLFESSYACMAKE